MQSESRSAAPRVSGWSVLRTIKSSGLAPFVSMLAVALTVVFVLGRELEVHIRALEAWLAHLGPWGLLAFLALFIVGTSLLLPDSIFCITSGALFGLGWGIGVVAVGALVCNVLQFVLARKLLRDIIQRILCRKPKLAAIQRAVLRDEMRLQVLLRLTPVNPALVNYLLGAAGVRFRGFLLASLLLHPTLFAEVYLGHAGKHMVRLMGGDATSAKTEDLAIAAGLVVCAVVVFLVSRMARKALREALDEAPTSAG